MIFAILIGYSLQWGAAYCVRGGPEIEKKAMEVCLFRAFIYSISAKFFLVKLIWFSWHMVLDVALICQNTISNENHITDQLFGCLSG